MNTRRPVSIQVKNVSGENQSDQSTRTIPPGTYGVVELPNGKYQLEGRDSNYEVEAAWLRGAIKADRIFMYGKWV